MNCMSLGSLSESVQESNKRIVEAFDLHEMPSVDKLSLSVECRCKKQKQANSQQYYHPGSCPQAISTTKPF